MSECSSCKGRGWHVGDCHPREECGACLGTGSADFVPFGDIARQRLGMQCQYARHYLIEPSLCEGIRWHGDLKDYHGLSIHKDDVEPFVERTLKWRREKGIIA